MSKWEVTAIDAGCDCCSFLPVATFDTKEEALAMYGNDDNYIIDEIEENLEPELQENVKNNGQKGN